ncbi:FecR domain-containing protein [Flavobacterium sp.]|uniref:FecR family protein n=1 Tax=Flavobacterium sp. TaxID=239 RepID=UPI00261B4527|nr:FecR domain-containing protein [Flavobacterium sp.]
MKEDVKLAKWLEGSMDENELREFMATPEFETYRKIKDYSAELAAPKTDIDALYTKVLQNREPKPVRKLTPWFTRIAAVLFVVLGVGYFFYATQTTNHIAAAGERTEFSLPDNSTVVLNAASEAEFRTWNWNNNREVQLTGEAFFKVAKGEKFDVVTPLGTVTVVGTQFNVKAREGRFYVSCFEGKVKVSSKGRDIMLTPGQSVIFEDGKNIAEPSADGTQPGWIVYDVAFKSEKLENVIAEMERQYKVDIALPAGDYSPYNGHVKMNDLNTALQQIELSYQLKSVREGDKIILTRE